MGNCHCTCATTDCRLVLVMSLSALCLHVHFRPMWNTFARCLKTDISATWRCQSAATVDLWLNWLLLQTQTIYFSAARDWDKCKTYRLVGLWSFTSLLRSQSQMLIFVHSSVNAIVQSGNNRVFVNISCSLKQSIVDVLKPMFNHCECCFTLHDH